MDVRPIRSGKIASGDRHEPDGSVYRDGVGYEEMVRRAVRDIQHRLDDPIDFRALAASAFVSPYHFHMIFRAMVGESPRELGRRLRLERAAHRLRDTDLAIAEVAAEAGYATPAAFTKSFLAEFEVAPSAFREAGAAAWASARGAGSTTSTAASPSSIRSTEEGPT